MLNELIEPFGFSYESNQDIFVSRTDAWQRQFGYGRIYDAAASSMNMVFDSEPVYFNYKEKTWLIQFWKGQYGINTGAEAGVYHADSIVPPERLSHTIFEAASDEEMLPMNIRLFTEDDILFCDGLPHWWLAGFCMGKWTCPSALTSEITIAFPDMQMREAFLQSMLDLGYTRRELCVSGASVRVLFTRPKSRNAMLSDSGLRMRYALWKTRIFCRIYLKITAPFCLSSDKLLYLYYFLPFAFRRTVRLRKAKKCGRYTDELV